jgi:hypothetical protein
MHRICSPGAAGDGAAREDATGSDLNIALAGAVDKGDHGAEAWIVCAAQ